MNVTSKQAADLLRLTWNWLPARYAHVSRLLGQGIRVERGGRAERALSADLLRRHALHGLWRREPLPFPWLLEEAEALQARAFEAGLASHAAALAMQLTRQARLQVAAWLGEAPFMRALQHAAQYPLLAAVQADLVLDETLPERLTQSGALLLASLLPQDDGVAQRFLLRFPAPQIVPVPPPPSPEAAAQLQALMAAIPVRKDTLFDWAWQEFAKVREVVREVAQ